MIADVLASLIQYSCPIASSGALGRICHTFTIQELLDKGLLQVQKIPAPVLAWLTMRLALLLC